MKKTLYITTRLTIILVMLFTVFSFAYAQPQPTTPPENNNQEYTLLVPLPGIGDTGEGKTNLSAYLSKMFNLVISLAAVLAFVMITWGGITYATTDAWFKKEEGKNIITNAVWGLVLVIASWLILYTINPQILNFNLVLPKPNIESLGSPGITPGVKMTDAQLTEHAANLAKLGSVKINNNGKPCANGETRGCTNLNGLPPTVIPALQSLVSACNCEIRINGGTEGGHASHGINQPIIDLDENPGLRAYIQKQSQKIPGNIKIISWKNIQGGSNYTAGFVYEGAGEGRSTGDHWHVVISNQ